MKNPKASNPAEAIIITTLNIDFDWETQVKPWIKKLRKKPKQFQQLETLQDLRDELIYTETEEFCRETLNIKTTTPNTTRPYIRLINLLYAILKYRI